jgi:hypothetical protein
MDLPLCCFLSDPVGLLQFTGENFTATLDGADVIVAPRGQFRPRSTFELLPVASYAIPVHR